MYKKYFIILSLLLFIALPASHADAATSGGSTPGGCAINNFSQVSGISQGANQPFQSIAMRWSTTPQCTYLEMSVPSGNQAINPNVGYGLAYVSSTQNLSNGNYILTAYDSSGATVSSTISYGAYATNTCIINSWSVSSVDTVSWSTSGCSQVQQMRLNGNVMSQSDGPVIAGINTLQLYYFGTSNYYLVDGINFNYPGGGGGGGGGGGTIEPGLISVNQSPVSGGTWTLTGPSGYSVSNQQNNDFDISGSYTLVSNSAPSGYQSYATVISNNSTGNSPTLNAVPPNSYIYTISYTAAGLMNGTLTTSDCIIASGASSCNSSLSWNTVNPQATSSVTTPTSITVANANTGSTNYPVVYGTRNFYLYNNGIELSPTGGVPATATCEGGSTWNGTICYSNTPSPLPDLTAGATTPTTAVVGTPITFSGTISNIGQQPTGASFNNLFQVATAINGGGTNSPISVNSMSALAASPASATATSSSYTFSYAGTYSVRLCADNNASFVGTINESNEGNNCSASWTTVDVSVAANTPPTVNAGPDKAIVQPTSSSAPTGASSSDSNGIQSNTWTFISGPVTPTIASASTLTPTFNGLSAVGNYVFRLTATDTLGASASDDMQVGVTSGSVMSGSISGTNCTILKNASFCKSSVTWSTTNPVGTSAVTKNPSNTVVANGNNGTNVLLDVKYNSETFFLYNNAVELGRINVYANCTFGTSWNGLKCEENPTGSCPNGADNAPACTTVNGNCINGAVNPPNCTITNGPEGPLCTNGGNNPPDCTTGSDGMCLNGLKNPPVCFNKKPIFKEN